MSILDIFKPNATEQQPEEVAQFDVDGFRERLISSGLEENSVNNVVADLADSLRENVREKTQMSYEDFLSTVQDNVEGLSTLPTNRVAACSELNDFLSQNPEVNNSIRLYASYIAYGSAETKLEEYRTVLTCPDPDRKKQAEAVLKKWEDKSKIKRAIYMLAKDIVPFGDAFLEKLYVKDTGDNDALAGVAYVPSSTMYPKLNNKGYPTKYYQIIKNQGDFADADDKVITNMVQDGTVIEFSRREILHFNDGSTIGVTDTPYYNLIILWRYLKMLEESLVIHRMTRARRFIVFFLDVSGKTRKEIRSAVSNFTQRLRSVFRMDVRKGNIAQQKSTIPASSDLVIPVTKDTKTKIQNIPADQSATKIDDLRFYLNRVTTNMFTSHIFNNGETSANDKYMEKSFMRLVKIYQRQMEYAIEDLYQEVLSEKHFDDVDIKIQFPSPDSEQEIRVVDAIVRRMMIVNQLTATLGVTPPTRWVVNYVFKDLAQYEVDELVAVLESEIAAQKENAQGDEYSDVFDESADGNEGTMFDEEAMGEETMEAFSSMMADNKRESVREHTAVSLNSNSDNMREVLELSLRYLEAVK